MKRRNWNVCGAQAVATWSLGLYAEVEHQRCRDAARSAMQSRPGTSRRPGDARDMAKLVRMFRKRQSTQTKLHASSERDAAFFDIPLVAPHDGAVHLMEVSDSGVGYYALQLAPQPGPLKLLTASFCGRPFQEGFVAHSLVDGFAAEVATRFCFKGPRALDPRSVCVAVAAVVPYRRRLSVDFEARHRCATFMRLVEERLRQQLNRVVHMYLFAPAPELVMKLELRASAQLLPKLVGILSARGCGLRLALRARYGSPRSLQVFTAVTKPGMHANELRTVLEVAGFPRSLCGVFVFTSDRSQRAAEAAGLTSGIFSTEDAVAALARRAAHASLLDHEGVAPELLAEFLQWSLQSDAQLLFREKWHFSSPTAVNRSSDGAAPLWALGLCLEQAEDGSLACSTAAARIQCVARAFLGHKKISS